MTTERHKDLGEDQLSFSPHNCIYLIEWIYYWWLWQSVNPMSQTMFNVDLSSLHVPLSENCHAVLGTTNRKPKKTNKIKINLRSMQKWNRSNYLLTLREITDSVLVMAENFMAKSTRGVEKAVKAVMLDEQTCGRCKVQINFGCMLIVNDVDTYLCLFWLPPRLL